MATIQNNANGTLTVTLTNMEEQTVSLMDNLDMMESYVTLWLESHAKQRFREKFALLSPANRATIMQLLRSA